MRPLLLCGHPRSGTTVLRSLLDGHPDVAMFPFEAKIVTTGMSQPGLSASRVLDEVLRRGGERLDVDALRATVASTLSGSDAPIGLGLLTAATVTAYARQAGLDGARYWADKTPSTERYLEILRRDLPDLRALLVVRDPRDVLVSHRGRRPFDAATLAQAWAANLAAWDAFVAAGGDGLLLRYEDLATDPAGQMARVADFLELTWTDTLTRPTTMGVPWTGNSSFGGQQAQVTSASVGRWRDELDPADARLVEQACSRALRRLGYDVSPSSRWSLLVTAARRRRPRALLVPAELARPAWLRAARRLRRRRGVTGTRPW